jgi:hypothetical protein
MIDGMAKLFIDGALLWIYEFFWRFEIEHDVGYGWLPVPTAYLIC